MTNEFIVKIIRRRSFHDIPDWMMKRMNSSIFADLLLDASMIIDEEYTNATLVPSKYYPSNDKLEDLISFLFRLGDSKKIKPKELALAFSHIKTPLNERTAMVLAYLFTSDEEWDKFLKHIGIASIMTDGNYIPFLTTHAVTICRIFRYRFGEYPMCIVDRLLQLCDYWMNHDLGDECIYNVFMTYYDDSSQGDLFPVSEHFHMMTGNDFIDDFFDILRKRSKRYYWGEGVFDISNIWDNDVPYFPEGEIDDQYLIAYLWSMKSCPTNELSERILDHIKRILVGDDIGLRNILFECVCDLFTEGLKCNPNNIRFLMPFYNIPSYQKDIDKILQTLFNWPLFMREGKVKNELILRDFTYFLPKDMNNDIIQRRFLQQQGGDPTTLLSDQFNGDTYLRTPEGVSCAIMNCNPIYLVKMLEDETICDIITSDIIGKVPFSPVIEKLIPVIERGIYTGNTNFYYIQAKLNRNYPLVETSTHICLPLLRISNMDIVESSSVVERWPIATFYISIYNQSANAILRAVNKTNGYVPLFFGLQKYICGIENLFTVSQMRDLLSHNNGYFADIKNETVAINMFAHLFMWED